MTEWEAADGAVVALEPSTGKKFSPWFRSRISIPIPLRKIGTAWISGIPANWSTGPPRDCIRRIHLQDCHGAGLYAGASRLCELGDLTVPAHTCRRLYDPLYRKRGSWTPDFPGGVREFLQLRLLRYGSVLECFRSTGTWRRICCSITVCPQAWAMERQQFRSHGADFPAEIMQTSIGQELR